MIVKEYNDCLVSYIMLNRSIVIIIFAVDYQAQEKTFFFIKRMHWSVTVKSQWA